MPTTSGDMFSAEIQLKKPGNTGYETVRDVLTREGFTVGPKGPASFSISGPRTLFEKFFGPLDLARDNMLSPAKLPEPARELVLRIVFTKLDFGPTSF